MQNKKYRLKVFNQRTKRPSKHVIKAENDNDADKAAAWKLLELRKKEPHLKACSLKVYPEGQDPRLIRTYASAA